MVDNQYIQGIVRRLEDKICGMDTGVISNADTFLAANNAFQRLPQELVEAVNNKRQELGIKRMRKDEQENLLNDLDTLFRRSGNQALHEQVSQLRQVLQASGPMRRETMSEGTYLNPQPPITMNSGRQNAVDNDQRVRDCKTKKHTKRTRGTRHHDHKGLTLKSKAEV